MNLRILKKLSKRAALLLLQIDDRGEHFRADPDEGTGHIGILIKDRKHWVRGRSVHDDCYSERMIKNPARDGNGWVYMTPDFTMARRGTMMVGGMDGGMQSEWSERSAWEALCELVFWNFVNVYVDSSMDGRAEPTRPLDTPSQIFKAAADMIAERQAETRSHEK